MGSKPYREALLERLKDPCEAVAYLDAALEDGYMAVLLLAMKDVTDAHGGVAKEAWNGHISG